MESRLKDFAGAFDREEFFEAHEILEDIWRPERGACRDAYRGLIQIAAAMHHLGRGNHAGARRLLDSAARLLGGSPSAVPGIATDRLLEEAFRALEGSGPMPKIEREGRDP